MAKIGFTWRTFGATKYEVKESILKSLESDKGMRKDMQRIIDIANKRISRLQSGDVISPALQALTVKHFSFKGQSWENAKIEYARAVSFLQQPTSTVIGSKEYGRYIQRTYDLTNDEYLKLGRELVTKVSSVDEQSFYDKYLRNYKDFSGELEQTAKDISDQIESDAQKLADNLQQELDKQAEEQANQLDDTLKGIMKRFKDFGL